MKKTLGTLGLIVTTIIWGGGFVASNLALKSFSPFAIMSFRFLIASIFMGIMAGKNIGHISKKEAFSGIFLGASLFAAFALQTVGLQYTTPSKNAFLTSTNVVIVPIIAYFIGKKTLEKRALLGVVTALLGTGVLSLQSDFSMGLGDLITLFGAAGFALQIYLTGEFAGKIKVSVLNFLQISTACILSFIGLLFEQNSRFDANMDSILAIIYLGAASTALCYFLQTTGQKYVDETKSAIILSLESVFGTIFSVIILNEAVTTRMVLGGSLILSAVLISEIKPATKSKV